METASWTMRRRVLLSSTVGNALEWFDFTVFGLFVVVISQHFFPAETPTQSLLKTFATFGIAFVARPLGGLLFGLYADRHGRKQALVVMIWMMALGTGAIGLLPTYNSIGLAAPCLILLARLVQGLSAGGEYGSASAMLIEFAPPGRRGLYGSFQSVSQSLAFVLGAGSAYLLTSRLSPENFQAWGWRIPFLLGVLIGPLGYFLRHKVDESPEFQQHLKSRQGQGFVPFSEVLRCYPRPLAVSFLLTAAGTSITYITSVFLPAYAANQLKLPLSDTQLGLVGASLVSAFLAPLAGWLSDRWGRRPVIFFTLLAFCALFSAALTALVQAPSQAALWRVQAVGMLLGFLAGPMAALMTEIFPVGVRSTGVSLMYNLAVMLFGGLAPAINTALIQATGNPLAPVYYIFVASGLGVLGLLLHRTLPHQGAA